LEGWGEGKKTKKITSTGITSIKKKTRAEKKMRPLNGKAEAAYAFQKEKGGLNEEGKR